MAERDEPRTAGRPDPELELLRLAGPRPAVPGGREARVREAVRAHWRGTVDGRRRRRRVWIAATLAAAALVAVGVLLPHLRHAPPLPVGIVEVVAGQALVDTGRGSVGAAAGLELVARAIVDTGEGGRVALRLGAASVRLDESTRVVVVSGTRIALEQGGVYIDADGPSHRPMLTVATAIADVVEVGTQFEVRMVGERVRVRVREGAAEVRRGGPLRAVSAGEEVSLGRDGRLRVGRIASDDPAWNWVLAVAPPFRLEGSTAASFLRWAARESGHTLRFADREVAAAAESIVLHGDATGVPPDQAPAAILPTCGLVHRLEDRTLVVGRPAN
ncbi:MAG: FecR domain-containing protein [Acidobacteriota bacterium]